MPPKPFARDYNDPTFGIDLRSNRPVSAVSQKNI
jgi:hypothetical protein